MTRRDGVALAVALLMTIALTLLAHAALVMTRTQGWVVRADGHRTEAEYRFTAAVGRVAREVDTLPGTGVRPTPFGPVRLRRLSPEVVLAESGPPHGGRGRVLYAPDPGERVRSRTAGLVVGGSVLTAPDATVGHAPPVYADVCPAGVLPGAPAPVWRRPGSAVVHPGVGPVPLELLRERLPPLGPGAHHVEPRVIGGLCVPETGNWGDPARVGGACETRWASGGVGASVSVTGAGQAFLAVTGDLVLEPGAQLRGWVLVGGDLVVREGASFVGWGDVGGHLRVDAGARVWADPCSAARALRATAGLRRPWTLGPRAWPRL